MIARLQYIHGALTGAPRIGTVFGSDPVLVMRPPFYGVGGPSAGTLPAGNGKYNAANQGWLINATLAAPGAGYKQNDVLTLQGGVAAPALLINVDSVDLLGAILDFHPITPTAFYTTYPNAGAGVTGGAGNGATFNPSIPAADLYVDLGGPTLYICTQAGSNAGSVWAQISGSGGGGFLIYNPGNAYTGSAAGGQIVYKVGGTNAGLWGAIANIAGGTNNIANLTFPLPANCPWVFFAPAPIPFGACAPGGQASVLVSATATF